MYLYHFGLKELPFTLTPNTRFFVELPFHKEALNVLTYALMMGEGFIKVTGEVGLGKTLLCRQLLNQLESDFVTAYIPNPYLSAKELRCALALELGLEVTDQTDMPTLNRRIEQQLIQLHQQGKPVVLLVDEAQVMPDETLEALRLFTNLETEQRKLLQVVLFAQPELDKRLSREQFRQLRQRVGFAYRLKPMSAVMVKQYVGQRLSAAGYDKPQSLFSLLAVQYLYRFSRGVPRLVNMMSHKSLLLAFGKGRQRCSVWDVVRAAWDTEDVTMLASNRWLNVSLCALMVLMLTGICWRYV